MIKDTYKRFKRCQLSYLLNFFLYSDKDLLSSFVYISYTKWFSKKNDACSEQSAKYISKCLQIVCKYNVKCDIWRLSWNLNVIPFQKIFSIFKVVFSIHRLICFTYSLHTLLSYLLLNYSRTYILNDMESMCKISL